MLEAITYQNMLKDINSNEIKEDKSLKDISHKTNVPLGTVKSRLNRTLKKLKIYMEV